MTTYFSQGIAATDFINVDNIFGTEANDNKSTMKNTFDDQNVEFHGEILSKVLK